MNVKTYYEEKQKLENEYRKFLIDEIEKLEKENPSNIFFTKEESEEQVVKKKRGRPRKTTGKFSIEL